jgi:hypothetical protein
VVGIEIKAKRKVPQRKDDIIQARENTIFDKNRNSTQ